MAAQGLLRLTACVLAGLRQASRCAFVSSTQSRWSRNPGTLLSTPAATSSAASAHSWRPLSCFLARPKIDFCSLFACLRLVGCPTARALLADGCLTVSHGAGRSAFLFYTLEWSPGNKRTLWARVCCRSVSGSKCPTALPTWTDLKTFCLPQALSPSVHWPTHPSWK